MVPEMKKSSSSRFPFDESVFPNLDFSRERKEQYQNRMDLLLNSLLEYEELIEVDQIDHYTNLAPMVMSSGKKARRRFRNKTQETRAKRYSSRMSRSRSHSSVSSQFDGEYRNPVAHPQYPSSFFFVKEYPGNVEEIIFLLNTSNTPDARRISSLWHSDLLDAAVLSVIKNEPKDPFNWLIPEPKDCCKSLLSLKWLAIETPSRFLAHRDSVYLQYTGITTDAFGEEVGYIILESIDIPEWPSLKPYGLNRHSFQQFITIRPSKSNPNSVKVMSTGSQNFFSYSISSWVNRVWQKSVENRFDDLMKHIDSNFNCLVKTTVTPNLWVSNCSRKSCFICEKIFGRLRLRHHCRYCGEIICRKCSVFRLAFGHSNDVVKTKVRICKSCIETRSQQSHNRNSVARTSYWSARSSICSRASAVPRQSEPFINSFHEKEEPVMLLGNDFSNERKRNRSCIAEEELCFQSRTKEIDFAKVNNGIAQQKLLVQQMKTKLRH